MRLWNMHWNIDNRKAHTDKRLAHEYRQKHIAELKEFDLNG